MPRRTSVGIDYNRVNLILAVMEKRVGMNLWGYDAYVNIAGGMKVNDTAVDLGVAFAIASSMNNKVVPSDTMIIGEIDLPGDPRCHKCPAASEGSRQDGIRNLYYSEVQL